MFQSDMMAQDFKRTVARLQMDNDKLEKDLDNFAEKERQYLHQIKETEDRVIGWISSFSAKFDQDFDTLTGLYKKIYQFLMLRCTGPVNAARAPSDPQVGKEVAAALESVFPRVGLRAFVALTGAERAAQLQELAGIVLGISKKQLWKHFLINDITFYYNFNVKECKINVNQ